MKYTLEVDVSHINHLDPTITLIPHDFMLDSGFKSVGNPPLHRCIHQRTFTLSQEPELSTFQAVIHRLLAITLDHNAFEEEISQTEKKML